MRIFLFFILALTAVCILDNKHANNLSQNIDEEAQIDAAFINFIKDYKRSYSTFEEFQKRRALFGKAYREIRDYNQAHPSVVLAINEFADLTDKEFEDLYLDPVGTNEKCEAAHPTTEPQMPDGNLEIDWVKKGMVLPVKNQGGCGSCWTFATISVVESIYAIKGNTLTRFAEQQVVDCCRKQVSSECPHSGGCWGGFVSEGLQYLANKGVMLASDYQYTAENGPCKYNANKIVYKIDGFVDIESGNVKEMERILKSRTFAVGVSASHTAFKYYESGIVEKDCPERPLNHAVTVVGAGTEAGKKYWLVRNSWGPHWGDKGYIKISRETKNQPSGVCGIAICPEYAKYKD